MFVLCYACNYLPSTRYQRLATVATFEVWALAQSRGDGHCSLVTLEMVLSEYNKDFILFFV